MMLNSLKYLAALSLIIIALVAVFWLINQKPNNTGPDSYRDTKTADSLEALKPSVRYGKPIATIEACKIYQIKTVDNKTLYVTVCNAPGVTASITVAEK